MAGTAVMGRLRSVDIGLINGRGSLIGCGGAGPPWLGSCRGYECRDPKRLLLGGHDEHVGAPCFNCYGLSGAGGATSAEFEVLADAFVELIVMEGTRAIGIRVSQHGQTIEHRGHQIVIAAGTLHSPARLQRAGIGPAECLRRAGVAVVKVCRASVPTCRIIRP